MIASRLRRVSAAAALAVVMFACVSQSLTRWSSTHMLPDADLIGGGMFVLDGQGNMFFDEADGTVIRPTIMGTLGIIEWVNVEGGYSGGPSFGLKARILGETHPYMPSLALGAHNVFSHKEVNYSDVSAYKDLNSEFYLALAKSAEGIATRFHLGIQTIPGEPTEIFNPYVGIEKYFGSGLYSTIEVHRRHQKIIPSVFLSWRVISHRVEISAGLVDLYHLMFKNDDFGFSFVSEESPTGFTRPGVWLGLRWLGDFGFGRRSSFTTLEKQAVDQTRAVDSLERKIDSLRQVLAGNRVRLSELEAPGVDAGKDSLAKRLSVKNVILDKILELKKLYARDPFEPGKVQKVIQDVQRLQHSAVKPLGELLADKSSDRLIRTHAAMLLGEIGLTAGTQALAEAAAGEGEPGVRIEAIIALGKLRDMRAMYLLEQLSNDQDDDVALTAREVLGQLSKESAQRPGSVGGALDTAAIRRSQPGNPEKPSSIPWPQPAVKKPAPAADSTARIAPKPSGPLPKAKADAKPAPAPEETTW